MRLLGAARAGLVVGFAITMPVVFWLGPQLLGRSAARADVPATIADALRALWIGQGVVLAFAVPRALGPGAPARVLGSAVVVAVALPVLVTAWLAHATGGRALARGVGLALACGAVATALAGALDAVPLGADSGRVVRAALEIGLAAAVWAFRQSWLAWIPA